MVIAIHALLLFAVIHRWGPSGIAQLNDYPPPVSILDLKQPPPPPPPPPQPRQQAKPRDEEGGSAPNIKSEATPIKAPEPKVVVPPLPQIAASKTPREGTAPTQGAAPVAGPGTGTGGSGNGTGTGTGSGSGGGGEGGVADPPHLVSPVLTGRDFSRELLDQWPRGATIFMRLRVRCAGLCQRMHGGPRHGRRGDRLPGLQPRARPAPFPARAQPQRTSGCRMVRIRATSAAVSQRESHDRSGMVGV